jgi:hypothetical protein
MNECVGHSRLYKLGNTLRVLPASFVLLCFLGDAPSHAEGVMIEGDHPAQRIDVNGDSASIATVLQTLREKYGIEISGADKLEADDPITLTISGNLPAILERLLRNQNYMLVRSPKNITGVSKILIAGASRGDASAKPPTKPPAPASYPGMP